MLELATLGGLDVRVGGTRLVGFGGKAAALLVYLACTRRPHGREALAELLWNEREPSQARSNLRVLLTRLPREVSAHLQITRETVTFDRTSPFRLDLDDFERHIHAAWTPEAAPSTLPPGVAAHLEQAVQLYRGPFLQGLYLTGAPGFEGWMLSEQDQLGRQATLALHTLVAARLAGGEDAAGVKLAARLLELDPLDEEAHRQTMRLLAAQGQRTAALRQYDLCRRRLAEELDAAPDALTVALADQIRRGEPGTLAAPPAGGPESRPSGAPRHLPPSVTPFVGREDDLTDLGARLSDPACRLVTVVGPGGSGKTRLALEVAERLDVPDGVFFVPLVAVADAGGLAGAVAGTIGLASGGEDPRARLFGWLRDRQVLLLLDGFEHLSGAPLLPDLLGAAPGVKLLVTSREPLHLRAECLVDLGGLDLPPPDVTGPVDGYAAIRLFVQSARRVQPRFTLTEENAPEVVRICRLVDGLPLGIELAAAWVRAQDCGTIARKIGRDLDFLASPLRDAPDRHRSMRAVFEHSWALLSEDERRTLRRLSVFRGGFEAAAAREVAEVGTRPLGALVDRSLLDRRGGTRYELHELLRQFAWEKLSAVPGEQTELQARHAAHYQHVAEVLPLEVWQLAPEGWEPLYERERDNLRAALEPEGFGERPPPVAHSPSEEHTYPIHTEVSLTIDRPVQDVFAFAGDLENNPRWQRHSGYLETRYTTAGPVGVGTGVESVMSVLVRRVRMTAVITEYLPGTKIAFRSTSGPILYKSSRTFEAVECGTRLTCTADVDAGRTYHIVSTAVARVTRVAMERDLAYLKRLLETSAELQSVPRG